MRRGTTSAEYGLLASLIVLVIAFALFKVGMEMNRTWFNMAWAHDYTANGPWGPAQLQTDFNNFKGGDSLLSSTETQNLFVAKFNGNPPTPPDFWQAMFWAYDDNESQNFTNAEWQNYINYVSTTSSGGPMTVYGNWKKAGSPPQ